jgi:SAM-dependent methyltransferase
MGLRVSLLTPRAALSCPCCGTRPQAFLSVPEAYVRECRAKGVEHPLEAWETLSLESYLCPSCGATDRDRLQVAFLREHLAGLPGKTIRALEIAPSAPVRDYLMSHPQVDYRSGDLERPDVDETGLDVADLSRFADGSFDLAICSHVLEHVPDDRKAMRELRRIVSRDGLALLLVPISLLVEDVEEDPELTDEAERWRRFGQGDHVRVYGRSGFERRLAESGWTVRGWRPEPLREFGLSLTSRLYVASSRRAN